MYFDCCNGHCSFNKVYCTSFIIIDKGLRVWICRWLSTVSKLYHLANPLFPCFLLNFTFTVEVNALNAYLKFKRKNVPTITNIMAVWLSPFNDCQFDFPIYVDLGLIISAVFLFCENLIEKKNRNDFKLGKD